MKLYGTPPTRASRVIWLLNELGLEYEMLPVDLLRVRTNKDFLALNPAGKIPVLVDGSVINRIGRDPALPRREKFPGGTHSGALEDRAQMYRWIFFLVTEIEQPLWRIARHTFVYRKRSDCLRTSTWRDRMRGDGDSTRRHMEERAFAAQTTDSAWSISTPRIHWTGRKKEECSTAHRG